MFDVSNQQADLQDLVIEITPFLVPPTGAVLAAVHVATKLRGKPEDDRGFEVTPPDRDGRGAA